MEKTKKSPWWTVLKIFLIILAVIVILFVGIIAFIKIAYDIDVFKAINKLKLFGKEPNITKIIDYGIGDQDLDASLVQLDNVGLSVIYTKDGDKVTFDPTTVDELVTMSGDLKLSDKQIGAIANTYLSTVIGDVKLDDETVLSDFELVQLKISDVQTRAGGYTSAKVNVVIKVGLQSFKELFKVFPLSMLNGFIPKTLYINSTNTITMTSDMLYTVEYNSLTVNNLSSENTAYIINLLNKFVKVGTLQSLGEDIGKYVGEVLIGGTDAKEGIAYALRPAGASSCHFEHDGTLGYFVIRVNN